MATVAERAGASRNAFRAIAGELQNQIANGAIEVGRYLPTERELQEQFDVSRSTIRRALAHLIDGGWAQNVPSKGVIAGSGIRPNRTQRIAFIDGQTYVMRLLFKRMSERFAEMGYELVHFNATKDSLMEDKMAEAVRENCAGIILNPYRGFPEFEAIREVFRTTPVVILDHRFSNIVSDYVTFDHFQIGYLATEHLLKNGCKRIAITGMLDMMVATHETFSGYMKAMFDNGVQPQVSDYLFVHTSGMDTSDTRLLEQRLRDNDRPDGIFVLSDDHVPTVIEAALRLGLRIPQDLKIMTVGDDVDIAVDEVGLSSIALDWEGLMHKAIELMIDRQADSLRSPKTITADYKMAIRGLCGSPKTVWNVGLHEATTFHGVLPIPRKQYAYRNPWSVVMTDNSQSRGLQK